MTTTTYRFKPDWFLWIGAPVILFVVAFAHMTALENIALGFIGVGTIALAATRGAPSPLRWPLLAPAVVWAAWALASVSWSAYPSESMHAWLDEVFYPLFAFFGFWLLGARTERPERFVFAHWLGCVLVAVISVVYWGQLQPPTADTFMLHFYNRVGHTSTVALFAMALFTGLMLSGRWRVIGVTGVLLGVFIGVATLNRFFGLAAFVTLVIALYPLYRRHMLVASAVLLLVAAAVIGTLEFSSRSRFALHPPPLPAHGVTIEGDRIPVPSFLPGIGDTLAADTRPRLWAFYGKVGEPHSWIGVGFGKPLPGRVYKQEIPPRLLAAEPQALTHAHNLFLNTWLETGIVGVVLEAALFAALAIRFWRLRRELPWLAAGGIALIGGMVAKNSTDDFMWQTTALAFWCFAGLMLGRGERLTGRLPPPRAPAQAQQ
ncbi:membrane protein [Caballeronia novacaledonica]|uniref:Membrane protein n=1 Tax=Caballeronia novacaledonica TaxID=1544861 RepID=A0A2U3IBL5_9BURK|nr:O-antigen ligase family protein [Caballeronia novacaledonica]SPB17608.1 membrane protein [Caballeronia novacaledonica]